MTNPTDMTPAEELAQLRKEAALREEERQADEDARELEELRLDAKLSAEMGKRGIDYEIVNTPFGVWGVRKPDAKGLQQWDRAVDAKEVSNERLAGILRHYIVPEDKALDFHRVATDRPGIARGQGSVGMAFLALSGHVRFEGQKKY